MAWQLMETLTQKLGSTLMVTMFHQKPELLFLMREEKGKVLSSSRNIFQRYYRHSKIIFSLFILDHITFRKQIQIKHRDKKNFLGSVRSAKRFCLLRKKVLGFFVFSKISRYFTLKTLSSSIHTGSGSDQLHKNMSVHYDL